MSVISDLIRTIDLEPSTEILRRAYYEQGYDGEFGRSATFLFRNNRIELFAPAYTRYMLFGRNPGKMPPSEPIRLWMQKKGIPEDYLFPIQRKIAENGTTGNNFVAPLLPQIIQSVKLQLVNPLTKAILSTLRSYSK